MTTLDEKYPNAYFDYWLSMLSRNKETWAEANFKGLLEEFRDMEGEKMFAGLQNELKQILENNDLDAYTLRAQEYHRKKINAAEIKVMVQVILEVD